ncbi:MAG: ClpXP protease specificity-enhancing factor [Proteobacteria bacterium]|nr:ClpXP protease specificity-enhancing factor [Pseudomonadota bacterium]
MNSSKPYILRALHEWISDNDCTPLVLVSSKHTDVQIPAGIDEDGKVVLNVSYGATKNLELTEQGIFFDARFSGVSQNLYLPIASILAIYAKENGQGMMFDDGDDESPEPPLTKKNPPTPIEKSNTSKATQKAFLKVLK